MAKEKNQLSNPFAVNDGALIIGGIVTVVVFLVVTLIAYPLLADQPVLREPTILTVTESSRMMDAGAAAIATDPSGKEVILYGDWARGDKVSAFPTVDEEQTSAAPKFTEGTIDPASDGWGVGYVFFGFSSIMAGVIFYILFTITGYFVFERIIDRRQRKQRESERIVNAALSNSGNGPWEF